MINNPATEIQDDLSDFLENLDNLPSPDPEKLEEITNSLLEDIAENTQHTSVENPICTPPITEKPVNSFDRQIIVNDSNTLAARFLTTLEKPFGKTRHVLAFHTSISDDEIFSHIKNIINTSQNHCFYFHNESIKEKFLRVLRNKFSPQTKVIVSNSYVTDLFSDREKLSEIKYWHETKTSHRGINETIKRISSKFYWPNMSNDINRYINICDVCQRAKYDRNPQHIKIQHTPTPTKPLDVLHIDLFHIQSEIYLTIFDPFSKYGQAIKLPSKNAIDTVQALIQFTSYLGTPSQLIADAGKEFDNLLLKEYCKLYGIELHITSIRNSNSNSPVERFHSTLLDSLRTLKIDHPNKPLSYLITLAVSCYNNSVHSVTKLTPFNIIFSQLDKNNSPTLNEAKITQDYINSTKNISKQLYETIQNRIENKKEQVLSNVNKNLNDPQPTTSKEYLNTKTHRDPKIKPIFKQVSIYKDKGPTVHTSAGTFHKNKVKKKRKLKPSPLFQDEDDSDAPLSVLQMRISANKSNSQPSSSNSLRPD